MPGRGGAGCRGVVTIATSESYVHGVLALLRSLSTAYLGRGLHPPQPYVMLTSGVSRRAEALIRTVFLTATC